MVGHGTKCPRGVRAGLVLHSSLGRRVAMSWVAADRRRVVIGAVGVLAGGFALLAGEPLAVVRSPLAASPREVFAVLVPAIIVVVGLTMVFGTETPVHESFTLSAAVLPFVIAVYLLVAVALVARGHTGWVTLSHLAVAAGGASVLAYSVFRGRPVGPGSG